MSTMSPALIGSMMSMVSVPWLDVAVKWMKPSDAGFAVAFAALNPVTAGDTPMA